jgi:hypothetical protein
MSYNEKQNKAGEKQNSEEKKNINDAELFKTFFWSPV